MKKVSVLFAAGLLLSGSSLTPTLAAAPATHSVVAHAAFPSPEAAAAFRNGQQAATNWYTANNPNQAALEAQYEFAYQNLQDSEDGSLEAFYWQGYTARLNTYR